MALLSVFITPFFRCFFVCNIFLFLLIKYAKWSIFDFNNIFTQEIECLKKINQAKNPHILKYIDFCESDNNYYILYENGVQTLQNFISQKQFRRLTQNLSLRIIYQIGNALTTYQKNNIFYDKLQPKNIYTQNKGLTWKLESYSCSRFSW